MEFSDAEWRIMREVWHWPSVTSRQVHSALHAETGWAYSTVKTMLTRLVEKGALRMSRDGNRSVFEPLVTRKQARTEATRSLVDRVFEGTVGGLFQHLLGEQKLSRKDEKTIRRLLEEQEHRKPKGSA